MKQRQQLAVLSCAVLALVASIHITAQTSAEPIPAGFDFPADEKSLLQMRDKGDVAGMRRHVWMVFGGMTTPTAAGEPVWHVAFGGRDLPGSFPPLGTRRPQCNLPVAAAVATRR